MGQPEETRPFLLLLSPSFPLSLLLASNDFLLPPSPVIDEETHFVPLQGFFTE